MSSLSFPTCFAHSSPGFHSSDASNWARWLPCASFTNLYNAKSEWECECRSVEMGQSAPKFRFQKWNYCSRLSFVLRQFYDSVWMDFRFEMDLLHFIGLLCKFRLHHNKLHGTHICSIFEYWYFAVVLGTHEFHCEEQMPSPDCNLQIAITSTNEFISKVSLGRAEKCWRLKYSRTRERSHSLRPVINLSN